MASSSEEVDSGPPSGPQWILESKKLPSICSLGKGLSGFIYETKWRGNKYARKDFPLGSEEGNSVFEDEVKSLFNLDHPNIVRCFGYTIGGSSCSLLQEYVDGDLQSTIRRRIEAQSNKKSKAGSGSTSGLRVVDVDKIRSLFSNKLEVKKITGVDEAGSSKIPGRSIVPFDVPEGVDIISQIAAGMEYLHDDSKHRVVHGDLKPKNVLLHLESGAMKVKLADFGLVETKKRIKLVSKRTQHFETLIWKAPELLEELLGPLTEDSDDPFTDSDTDEGVRCGSHGNIDVYGSDFMAKADVYSFGLTCSHILGGKLLYPDLSLTELRRQRMHGFRPELPSATCPDYLRDLIYSCLEFDPMSRPTFSYVHTRLKAPMKPQRPLLTRGDINVVPVEDHHLYPQLDSYQIPKPDSLGKPDSYLNDAEACMDAVQKMSSRKFNNEQCGYLADKLKVAVQCASLFLEVPQAQCDGPPLSEDIATSVEIFKLLLGCSKEIETFVQGCCNDAWIQAAMTLTNVSDYVSSLGFNLELCQVAFCKDSTATRSLTLDQVHNINKAEVDIVQKKASHDFVTLLAKVTSELNTLSGENADLAGYLLQRLKRVTQSIPSPFPLASSLWCVRDDGSFLEKLFQSVKQAEHLARGASSDVYKAMWLGRPVAKKTFQGCRENPGFMLEVEILAKLCHPNVTSMFCCAKDNHKCSIIMELMDEDLKTMMERRVEKDCDSPPFPILEGIDIMLQIGEGVNYLHNNGIMHRDLKATKILVKSIKATKLEGGYVHAKVSDFGLLKTKDCCRRYSNKTFQASKWMPPEMINLIIGGPQDGPRSFLEREKVLRYSLQWSDVYSFAMVCYEILTADEPFQSETSFIKVKEKVMKGKRPYLPYYCPAKLKALIKKCWHQDPKKRPTFAIICLELKYLKYSLMRGMSTTPSNHTASNYTAWSMSTSSSVDSNLPQLMHDNRYELPLGMTALSDEVLRQGVFAKLPLFDLLRARAVCKRWQEIAAQSLDTFNSQDETKSYCPLIFRRNSLHHLWCGYDSATGAWELLPPLTNLPQVDIRPLAGNGKSLMGFKITSVPSQVVVGNPFTSDWQTIPKSTETWGEVGNVLVVDRNKFGIISVREDATEIYHSKEETWTKLRQKPPPGMHEITVLAMKDKFISGTLCGGLLFCYGGDVLLSFDVVAERWTKDHIRLPSHASPKCFQMLECGGNLFAAIEDVARGTISVLGLGLGRRQFFDMCLMMPPHFYSLLCGKLQKPGKQARVQLKAVGHKYRMYFWRNLSHNIVMFDYPRRTWAELPQFDQCLYHATGDQSEPDPEYFQTFVDTGSFEP